MPEEVYGNGRHIHPGYEKGSLILLHLYQKEVQFLPVFLLFIGNPFEPFSQIRD